MSKSTNFTLFWDHHDLVQKWVKSSKIARQRTLNDFEWKATKSYINPLLNLSHISLLTSIATGSFKEDQIQKEITSVEIEDSVQDNKEEELSPEMIEFYKITIKHREEREKKRKHEEDEITERRFKNGTWLNDNDDEYILASEIGINGIQKQTIESPNINSELEEYRLQKRAMYGSAAEKLIAMELAMSFKFKEHNAHFNPSLWPNIPLRF